MSAPEGPPPSYAHATGSSTDSKHDTSHLQVPHDEGKNGIPAAERRSMEDELRPLPPGWVRQFDAKEEHQFYVDTNATPPRSIWMHPYDDDEYLSTLTSEERERIQEDEHSRRQPDLDKMSAQSAEGVLPPRPDGKDGQSQSQKKGLSGFGRKFKDKVTGSTHEERKQMRAQREEEERQYYEAHQAFRRAMQRAQMTGEPQLLGKDKDGKDVYVEPPQVGGYGRGYGGGYGGGGGYGAYGGGGGYRAGASMVNPYSASGPYANPNARFIRPPMPYNRPYGPGYGGGYGVPLGAGLLGGVLLGGLLF